MSALQKLRTTEPYDPMWMLTTIINKLMYGSLNSVGRITLRANQTTTTLPDGNIGRSSKIFLTPITAHAATVTGLWYDPSTVGVNGGSITLNHSSVNQTDLTFDYVVLN